MRSLSAADLRSRILRSFLPQDDNPVEWGERYTHFYRGVILNPHFTVMCHPERSEGSATPANSAKLLTHGSAPTSLGPAPHPALELKAPLLDLRH